MLDMLQILEVLILRLHNNLLLVIKGCDSNFEPETKTLANYRDCVYSNFF